MKKSKLNTHSLSGSSLIEVLTSLSILSLLLVIGLMLFNRLTLYHSPPQVHYTRALVQNYLQEPISPSSPKKEKREILGRKLIRTITPIENGLSELKVSCFLREQLIEERSIITRLAP